MTDGWPGIINGGKEGFLPSFMLPCTWLQQYGLDVTNPLLAYCDQDGHLDVQPLTQKCHFRYQM